jgi:hypothetical protein
MRCLIGFFGITRSLRHTAGSIHAGFFEPLRQAGITTLRVGHFNLPERLSNPRSGEFDVVLDRAESGLLALDLCWVEPQSDGAIAAELLVARGFPDSFGDQYRSLANLCHQLRSLQRLWSLLQLAGIGEDDLVLLLRPDLLYLDRFDPAEQLAPLLQGRADLIVPSWQSWGGLNDRFAFCTARAARIYATRFRLYIDSCREMGGMHAETFLHFVASCHRLRVGLSDLRAVRVRADGRVAGNDAAMLAGARAEPAAVLLSGSPGEDDGADARRDEVIVSAA